MEEVIAWDLKDLYDGVDSEAFKKDFAWLDEGIEESIRMTEQAITSQDNALEKIKQSLEFGERFNAVAERVSYFLELTQATDTSNQTVTKLIDQLHTKLTQLTGPAVRFQKWFVGIPNIKEILKEDAYVNKQYFVLSQSIDHAKYLLSEQEESLLSQLHMTASGAWSQLQEKLTSQLMVDVTIAGKTQTLPLPQVDSMIADPKEEVRREAFLARDKAYPKITEPIASALNAIKGESIISCKKRGYADVLESELLGSHMRKETLDALLGAMKESLSVGWNFYKRKAKLLGDEKGLKSYNMLAPLTTTELKLTYPQIKEQVLAHFLSFSPKLHDFAQHAFTNNWLDITPRKGKLGGGFCAGIHSIQQSRILTNFTGTFNDLLTIAHELGHAYHNDCQKNEPSGNTHNPYALAETASTFCETIVMHKELAKANEEEKLEILQNYLSSSMPYLVEIYGRFIFEDRLLEQRKNGPLSVEEISALMEGAMSEAYGDSMDPTYPGTYGWVAKPHYYMPDLNYYNFPYSFGALFALGLYAQYKENPEAFVASYDDLLANTGKMSIEDVAKQARIDVTDKAFWLSSIAILQADVEEFLRLTA